MKVCVIGLGYIGLPTAAILADKGVLVEGVDVNEKVVETVNRGLIHIEEKGLGDLVKRVVSSGKLKATTKPSEADFFLIAVPTPFKDNHVPDLKYVEEAVRSFADVLKKGDSIIFESTSPVGTTEKVQNLISELRPDLETSGEASELYFAYCPERVLPGRTLEELISNDRIVGGVTPAAADRVSEFYKVFVEGEISKTDSRTAEMAKLTENAFRDLNIAFANELSIICDSQKINVWELISLCNHHPR